MSVGAAHHSPLQAGSRPVFPHVPELSVCYCREWCGVPGAAGRWCSQCKGAETNVELGAVVGPPSWFLVYLSRCPAVFSVCYNCGCQGLNFLTYSVILGFPGDSFINKISVLLLYRSPMDVTARYGGKRSTLLPCN